MNFINDITSYFDGSGTKDASDSGCKVSLSLWSLCGEEVAGYKATSSTSEAHDEAVVTEEAEAVPPSESKSTGEETPTEKAVATEEPVVEAVEEAPATETEEPSKPSVLGRIKRSFRKKPSKSKNEGVEESTTEKEVDAPEEESKLSKPSILSKVKRSFRAAKEPAAPAAEATDDVTTATDDAVAEETTTPEISTNEVAEEDPTTATEEDAPVKEEPTIEDEVEATKESEQQEVEELVETVENDVDEIKDEAKLSKPSLLNKVKRSFVKKASRTDEDAAPEDSSDARDDNITEVIPGDATEKPEEPTEDSIPSSPSAPADVVLETPPIETEDTQLPKGLASTSIEEKVSAVSESIPVDSPVLASE